jgi:hypothetical protein
MNRVDGFAVKIASLNTLAFSWTAAAVTYMDARLKTHLAFGARHYPHGYQISVLGGIFVCTATLLVFAKISSWQIKAVLPAILLALTGALSLPFFRPEFPHGGISGWTFAFSVLCLFTCFIHLLPLQADWLQAPEVSTATRYRRARDSAAQWRIIAILITVAYIVLLLPWATFIWNQSPHIVADPGEAFQLSELGASGMLGCSVYMLLGVIYESFHRSLDAGDLALRIKTEQPRSESKSGPPGPRTARDQVFISYSRKDRVWLDRLQTMLKPLVRNGAISVWAETSIRPGGRWKEELQQALASAKVAVLLVSDNFLASDFITQQEVPPLLAAAKEGKVRIVWLYLSHCRVDATPIADYQAAHDITQPLDELPDAAWKRVLRDVAETIQEAVRPHVDH